MSVDFISIVDTNLELLCEILDIDELFLTALHGDGAIDVKTKAKLLSIESPFERNECFLDWLKQCSPESFKICMEQLRYDHQQHIANLLEGTPGELPLSEDLKRQLQKNIRGLSEIIDTHSGIIDYLWSKDAINTKYQQYINSVPSDIEKNVKLINIITKKSDRTYNFFLEALIATGQGHVIEYLAEGTITAIHVKFQGPPNDLTRFEHYVTEYFNSIARDIQPSEVEERTKQLRSIFDEKIKIIRCKQVHSIMMFLWCKDDDAALELLCMFESKQLERELEQLFSSIKTPIKMPNLIIKVTMTTEDLLSLRRTASLLNSEALSSLTHEELQQRQCHLKPYAAEMEHKMAAYEAFLDELLVKSAKLESDMLTMKRKELEKVKLKTEVELALHRRELESLIQKQQKGGEKQERSDIWIFRKWISYEMSVFRNAIRFEITYFQMVWFLVGITISFIYGRILDEEMFTFTDVAISVVIAAGAFAITFTISSYFARELEERVSSRKVDIGRVAETVASKVKGRVRVAVSEEVRTPGMNSSPDPIPRPTLSSVFKQLLIALLVGLVMEPLVVIGLNFCDYLVIGGVFPNMGSLFHMLFHPPYVYKLVVLLILFCLLSTLLIDAVRNRNRHID